MNARERFKVGGRVRLTLKGTYQLRLWTRTSTVRGFTKRPNEVRVQADGNRTVGVFHESYWEADPIPPVCHLMVRSIAGGSMLRVTSRDLEQGRCPICKSGEWWWGPEGGATTMYRSPCGLWVAFSPCGVEIVDAGKTRWCNPAAKCSLGGEKGSYP